MLKKRSKTVSSKQGVVSHNISLTPLIGNLTQRPPSCFLFPSINPFSSFSPTVFSDSQASVSRPNFSLDFKPFFSIGNPLISNRKPKTCCLKNGSYFSWEKIPGDSRPVGLAILEAICSEKADEKLVLFGSQLKVQILSINRNSSSRTLLVESPHSPIEFGIKNKNSQLAMAVLSPGRRSPLASTIPCMDNSPRGLHLSASEIELSEDYTCVISHGPQQKTTHIFDNFIIESCSNRLSSLREMKLSSCQLGDSISDYFLTFCHTCQNKIAQGNEIFIYRGDKAFCSQECRNREIICQERRENSGSCA
ncbi:hypothetical protein KFK09_020763 [Dendrobium nobile]|uniref:FLZ-type domain-containing protein n=1 Tax=Dendrobium nobile TaxID=94219 RepID=A0A8T3AP55_DENNO|nr:hypothetical protein KFK09_020763 [Dendrobium nobile]